MFATAFNIIILLIVFHIFHELGHLLSALLLKLRIKKVGIALKPIPHTYIHAYNANSDYKKILYQLSGFIVFLILLTAFIVYTLLYPYSAVINNNTIILAFFIQFLIETNPKYSDFVIIQLDNKIKRIIKERNYNINYKAAYQRAYREYLFSKKWYIHFTLWTLSILLIYKYILL